MPKPHVAIIGAGPAGLTSAYLLGKEGVPVTVLEKDPRYVGGISRTEQYKGFHFDIGGHRFFSKSKQVEDFWTEILGDDMLVRPRSSRIFYGGKFFAYPLRGIEALQKLGPVEAARCLGSYLKARAFPVAEPKNFQDWVSNQFGRRLFEIFFKTYTEKVWGMPCSEISADWAAQRIKGLSLASAIANALIPRPKPKEGGAVIKTLIDSFRYPRRGPGMMWEACAERVRAQGGQLRMGTSVEQCHFDGATGRWTLLARDARGVAVNVVADHVISSAPMRALAASLTPNLSEGARAAALRLWYRDFLTVTLILEDRQLFDDNWIYIHEPAVRVGRIQNFRSWSPWMVPNETDGSIGMEYFCFEGDGLWSASDQDLIALAKKELEQIGLCEARLVLDGCVVRQPKAYPVYDDGYAENVETVRRELKERFRTLHLTGRNGMHKYNNQDHSMMTAMLTVENILAGREVYDPWSVNEDAEYHEQGDRGASASAASGLRAVPRAVGG
ncbi:MAG: NAD(P)/FAD-dependent oxidoreductase [Myxococcales bacterium]